MDVIPANDSRRVIPYRPALAAQLGSVTAAILLQQIVHWYAANGHKPFYKFKEPCRHADYRAGDSWTEELAFSRTEFDRALKVIAARGRPHLSEALVFYWTEVSRKTYYTVNKVALRKVGIVLYQESESNFRSSTEMINTDEPNSRAYLAAQKGQSHANPTDSGSSSQPAAPGKQRVARPIKYPGPRE